MGRDIKSLSIYLSITHTHTHIHTDVWLGEFLGQKVAIMMVKDPKNRKAYQQFQAEAAIMT